MKIMIKLLSILTAVMIILCLMVGCKKDPTSDPGSESQSAASTDPADNYPADETDPVPNVPDDEASKRY